MIRKLLRYSMIGASAAFTASTSSAQSPEDLVRWIYTSLPQPGGSLGYVTSEAERDRYLSHRLAAFFAADDSYGDDMQSACLDFGPAIPGNDYNAEEIVRSLAVSTEVDGAQTRVKAAFTTFGEPVEIVYSFVVEDGLWQLDDIAGPGYRLSEIPCTPRAASPQAAAKVTGYCYRKAQDSLRLEVAPDGQAHFELWSEQGGGHSCSATGPARPTQSGWVYEEDFSGTSCRVEILVTAERGLRLTDKNWACKPALCGARAVLDGLSFAPQDQIDCATLPPLGQ